MTIIRLAILAFYFFLSFITLWAMMTFVGFCDVPGHLREQLQTPLTTPDVIEPVPVPDTGTGRLDYRVDTEEGDR